MIKIKKVFNFKIIPLFIAGLFLFNSAVYGINPSNKSHLRVPSHFNRATEKFIRARDEGQRRVAESQQNVALVALASSGQPAYGETYALSALAGSLTYHLSDRVNVSILDMYADHSLTIDGIVDAIANMGPEDVVGFSLTAGTADLLEKILFKLEQRIPKDKMPQIAFGNTLATYLTERLLREYYPEAIAIIGEGDLAIIDIVKYARGEIDKRGISNAAFLEDDELVKNKRTVLDVSKLAPPDRSRIKELTENKAQIFIEASRGCQWADCLFCPIKELLGGRRKSELWRPRPVKDIIKDMKLIQEAGAESFTFSDEEFFGDVSIRGIRRIKELAQAIIENNSTLKFRLSCRADSIYNPEDTAEERQERIEVFRLLKQAGLRKVFIGIESGSEVQLKRYNKGISRETNKQAINIMRGLGIDIEIGFIMFDPECTREDILASIDFIEETGMLYEISGLLNQLRVQAGAPIAKVLERKGLLISDKPDMESLCYTVRYKHEYVQRLIDTITQWSSDISQLGYILKSRTRFRLKDETPKEIKLYRDFKDQIRNIEFEFLRRLASLRDEELLNEELMRDLQRQYSWKQAAIAKALLNILLKEKNMDTDNEVKNRIIAYLDTMLQQEKGIFILKKKDITEDTINGQILAALLEGTYDGIMRGFTLFRESRGNVDIEVPDGLLSDMRIDNATLNMIVNLITKDISEDEMFHWALFLIQVKPIRIAWMYNKIPGVINFLKECRLRDKTKKLVQGLINSDDRFSFLTEPIEPLVDKKERKKILEMVFEEDIPAKKEILPVRNLGEPRGSASEGIFLLKPGGTFNNDVLLDVLRRIANFGYTVDGVRVFDGGEIAREKMYHRHHDYAYRVTKDGKEYFTEADYDRLRKIYDTPEFKEEFGSDFKETSIIAAYQLLDYGLNEQDIIALWAGGYKSDRFRNGKHNGLNKIGFNKYVFPASHPKVNSGKVFFLVNGFYMHMTFLTEAQGAKTIAILMRGKEPYRASWIKMRDEFLGETSPLKALPGSMRRDAFIGVMNVTEELEFWKNVAHYSAGPIEAMMEATVWFDIPVEDTAMGRLLLEKGYTKQELEFFVSDPIDDFEGKETDLFGLTENLEPQEALALLLKMYPPYYSDPDVLPSISYQEFMTLMKAHDEGRLSVATNRVSSDRISLSSRKPVDFSALSHEVRDTYSRKGTKVIQNGELCQIIMSGGTGGRMIGYDVPERFRIRGFVEPLKMVGRLRSFFELKVANALTFGDKIQVRLFTNGLNRNTIMDFFKGHSWFGAREKDIKPYTQGSIPRLNPTRDDIRAEYPDASREEVDAWIRENGGEEGVFRFKSGEKSYKPPGHLDVFNSLVLSKELLRLIEQGVEYLHISAESNIGAIIDPALIGYLAESDKDILAIMVEKNHIFRINDLENGEKFSVIMRNGKIVYSSLPEGLQLILKDEKITGIINTKTSQSLRVGITEELEKGGTLVDLDGSPIILEGFRFPSDFDQASIPYFWSAHFLVKTKALLKLYRLNLEEYRTIPTEELIKKVTTVNSQVGAYIEIKDVLDESTGRKRKAAQISRLFGEIAALLNTGYVLIDRDGVETGCAFLPYKSQEDIKIFEETALRVLHNRVALLSNEDKPRVGHNGCVITIDGSTASGKTSVAKSLAGQIGAIWLEYSSLYRAATLIVLEAEIPIEDKDSIVAAILSKKIEIRINEEKWSVLINGIDVFDKIYPDKPFSKLVMTVPKIAEISEIRQHMIPLMRQAVEEALSRNKIVVVSGHVVGKEVFPNADLKIFLEAPLETRAIRWQSGSGMGADEIQDLIEAKDSMDKQRKVSPLSPAEDAILIDTFNSSPERVTQKIAQHLTTVRLSHEFQFKGQRTEIDIRRVELILNNLVPDVRIREFLIEGILAKIKDGQQGGLEIEKKFLLSRFPEFLNSYKPARIIQGYLFIGDGLEIRVRKKEDKTFFTVKTEGGLSRGEIEFQIPLDTYDKLITLAEKRVIVKDRYSVPLEHGFTAEIDRYLERHEGLVVLEVELPDAGITISDLPVKFGAVMDVTDDRVFKNKNLASETEGYARRRVIQEIRSEIREGL